MVTTQCWTPGQMLFTQRHPCGWKATPPAIVEAINATPRGTTKHVQVSCAWLFLGWGAFISRWRLYRSRDTRHSNANVAPWVAHSNRDLSALALARNRVPMCDARRAFALHFASPVQCRHLARCVCMPCSCASRVGGCWAPWRNTVEPQPSSNAPAQMMCRVAPHRCSRCASQSDPSH